MHISAHTTKNIIAVAATTLLLAGLGGAFLLTNAGAQESPRILTIVPPSKEYPDIKPGDKQEGELKLINDSDQTMTFTASAPPYLRRSRTSLRRPSWPRTVARPIRDTRQKRSRVRPASPAGASGSN